MARQLICVAQEAGASVFGVSAVLSGVRTVLDLIDPGRKRFDLAPKLKYVSAEAILKSKYAAGILDGDKLIGRFRIAKNLDHTLYALALNQRIVYKHDNTYSYCFGLGSMGVVALVEATWPPNVAEPARRFSVQKRLAIHEVGHMLGLILTREEGTEKALLKHCVNSNCIMHAGGSFSADVDVRDPYCKECFARLLGGGP